VIGWLIWRRTVQADFFEGFIQNTAKKPLQVVSKAVSQFGIDSKARTEPKFVWKVAVKGQDS